MNFAKYFTYFEYAYKIFLKSSEFKKYQKSLKLRRCLEKRKSCGIDDPNTQYFHVGGTRLKYFAITFFILRKSFLFLLSDFSLLGTI